MLDTKHHRRGGNPGGGQQMRSAWGCEQSPRSIAASRNQAPLSTPLAVYAGRTCIGFIRPRDGGFEALDLDRRSLGTFRSRSEAADAIEDAVS